MVRVHDESEMYGKQSDTDRNLLTNDLLRNHERRYRNNYAVSAVSGSYQSHKVGGTEPRVMSALVQSKN